MVFATVVGSPLVFSQTINSQKLAELSLIATCTNCHSNNGNAIPNSGMPSISHLSSDAMLTQLKAFKSGARAGTVMPQLAKGYTDEQLQVVAELLGKKI